MCSADIHSKSSLLRLLHNNGVDLRNMLSCQVPLRTSDGEIVKVDRDVIRHSALIDELLKDLLNSGDASTTSMEPIPLAEVDAKTLKKVLEWCEHHKEDNLLSQNVNTNDEIFVEEIPEWDEQYLQMEDRMLFDVVLAANFLNVKMLMEMACKMIAEKMKGRTPEELRAMFSVENDLTEEDVERISQENSWCEGW
uniref:Skp1-related protein n=1 Tax=Parascaris univalens TaxID=6257 RepID=A0A915CAT0_PARUN